MYKTHQKYFLLLCLFLVYQFQLLAQQGQFISLKGEQGLTSRAYLTGPQQAKAGIILVHDYFGISPATLEAADHLGKLGYRVLAVDLYGGRSASRDDSAEVLLKMKDSATIRQVLLSAIRYLNHPGRKLVSIGFSAGGIDALRANLLEPSIFAGTIIIYGGSYDQIPGTQLTSLSSPVLAITGSKDEWALSSALHFMEHEKNKSLELYVYPGADHGYAQPFFRGGKNLNPQAVQMTWVLIEHFLSRTIQNL